LPPPASQPASQLAGGRAIMHLTDLETFVILPSSKGAGHVRLLPPILH
jgi:hypothetical protein